MSPRMGSTTSLSLMGGHLSSTAPTSSPLSHAAHLAAVAAASGGPGSSVSLPRDLMGTRRKQQADPEGDETYPDSLTGANDDDTDDEEQVDDGVPKFDCPHVSAVLYKQHMGVGYSTEAIKAILLHLFRRDPLASTSLRGRGGVKTSFGRGSSGVLTQGNGGDRYFVFGESGRYIVNASVGGVTAGLPFENITSPSKISASLLDDYAHEDGEESDIDDDVIPELDEDVDDAEDGDDDGVAYPDGGVPGSAGSTLSRHVGRTSMAGERVLERLGFCATGKVEEGGREWSCFEVGRDGFWEVWVGSGEEEEDEDDMGEDGEDEGFGEDDEDY
ncbi:hypothetical protein BC829DRAFT_414882 [Chytridium lagenaria]|nr:hypothetical protein BC829DRAFT_414882 [Chytridium lagenaria]